MEALQPDDQKLTMAAKTFDYIVVLKQRDFKLVDNISIMMLLLAIIVLLEKALTPFSNASVFPLAVATLISGWIIFTFIKKRNGKTGYYRIGLLFADELFFPSVVIIDLQNSLKSFSSSGVVCASISL